MERQKLAEYEPQGITGELREKLSEYEPHETADEFIAHPIGAVGYDIMTALCDSIDAVHASLERENAELRDELRRIKEDGNDGLVELPKDANGKHIQPSDIPYLTTANSGKRLSYCPSLSLREDGTWVIAGRTPDRYRILKPTVEDVLREMLDVWGEMASEAADEAIVAEYAAKLCLAGDAE